MISIASFMVKVKIVCGDDDNGGGGGGKFSHSFRGQMPFERE